MSVQRPLSPFMLGSVYRPQLTSVLSILHRITGLILSLGALGLIGWTLSLASGPESYARFEAFADGSLSHVLVAASVFALSYHLGNGVRHLCWDAGWGFDLKTVYASGYAVVLFALICSGLALAMLEGGR